MDVSIFPSSVLYFLVILFDFNSIIYSSQIRADGRNNSAVRAVTFGLYKSVFLLRPKVLTCFTDEQSFGGSDFYSDGKTRCILNFLFTGSNLYRICCAAGTRDADFGSSGSYILFDIHAARPVLGRDISAGTAVLKSFSPSNCFFFCYGTVIHH